MTELDPLYREIAREEDELRANSDALQRARANFETLEVLPNRRSRFRLALGVAVSLAFALGGVVGIVGDDRALRASVGEAKSPVVVGDRFAAPDARALPLSFSDGTRIEIAPGSRAHLAELESDGARLVLESGSAHVEVVHRRGARWNLSAGPFTVRVTGTRFDLAYSPEEDELELSLADGQVELSGCVFGAGRRLAAGQTVRASCKRQHVEISFGDAKSAASRAKAMARNEVAQQLPKSGSEVANQVGIVPPGAPSPAEDAAALDLPHPLPPVATSTAPATAKRRVTRVPSAEAMSSETEPASSEMEPNRSDRVWLKLAQKGMYSEAFAAAEAEGFEAECNRSRAPELALLGDAARHTGNREKAAQAFLLLRRKFAGTTDAALAAFALGRLEFDVNGAYAKAAQWFRTYLNEQRGAALAREALGRLIESLHRAGDEASARELAVTYLRDYPAGPHAELSSRILAEP